MLGETIIFGKNKRDQARHWKAVHETEDSVTYMLYDLGTESMAFYDAKDYLQKDFMTVSEEERSRIIPNEAGDLVWLPSVKQLGFVPIDPDERDWRNWGMNSIPVNTVPEKVWNGETFQYFSDPETAAKRRKEFGDWYWTSTPYVSDSNYVWRVSSVGFAHVDYVHRSREVRPCIILKKEES